MNLFTNAEAGYLAGVTTNIGSKLNLVTASEVGRLAGVTSGIQSQIDAAFSAIASAPSATGRIARTGDTMSGTLGLAGANTTPDRVAYLNANRELVTSTVVSSAELDFIDGVTSNVGSKLNLFTASEASRLAGVTSGIQSQIDSAFSAINSIPSATNRVAKVGDTMTGGLGFQYAGVTPSRVAYIDANRQLMTSNTVTNAELDFLAGVTSGIQSQIDAAFSAISSSPSATGRIARTGDTMSGTLGLAGANTTPDRVAYLNANRELVTSTLVSSAELDFIDGVTSNVGSKLNLFTANEASRLSGVTSGIQSQIDSAFSAINSIPSATNRVAKVGDTMTGGLGFQYAGVTPSRVAYIDANRQLMTSNTVTNAELDFLSGVTSNLGAKVNLFTNAEAGRLAGVTSGIQSQIDSAFSAISSIPSATNRVAKTGDTMTGDLNLANQKELRFSEASGSGTNYIGIKAPATLAADLGWTLPDVDGGNNQLMKFNATTKTFYWDNDAGAAGGVTGPGASSANGIARWNGTAGTTLKSSNIVITDADTMNGIVGLTAASINVTGLAGSKVLVSDSAKNISESASVDTTELGFLDGVTSNLGAKVNLFTANEASRLAGVTSGIQSQIDSAFSAINSIPSATNRVAKVGDTMTGGLGFQYAGVTPSRVAYIDANRQLMTSNTVTNAELDFLSGVTSNLGARVNLFTNAEAGYLAGVTMNIGSKINLVSAAEMGRLAGVTSGIQSQIDAAFSAIASSPSATGRIARTGDTMSGTLGLAGANTTPDRVAYLNANRELVTSTVVSSVELDFIDGVTSNVGSKLNLFTANEAGRLAGVTSGIQSQIDSAFSAINSIPSATNRVAKVGDTMTGGLGFQYAGVTPSRVAYIDANRQLMTSNTVTNTELDFLSGVTSNLGAKVNLFSNAEAGYLAGVTTNIGSKINLVSAAEMGRLAGVTSGIQSQIDAAFSAIASAPSATGRIARTGDTMSGTLGLAGANTTPDRVAYLNANRELVTSTVVSSAELDFIDGVTSNVGSKVNLFTATEAGYLAGVTTNIGSKLNLASAVEMGRLAGVTSGIQSQIDSAFSAMSGLASSSSLTTGLNAKLNRAGDTMTGDLNLANQKELRFSEASGSGTNYIGIKAPATLAADLGWTLPDVDGGNNQLMKFNATTKTFYWDNDAGAAGGVTGPGSSAANGIARWNGTAGSTLKSSNVVITDADTISGVVGITAANVNLSSLSANQVLITDAVKNIAAAANVDATELDYLDGVTSNLGLKVNRFSNTQGGYLGGVTTSLIAQLGGVTSNIGDRLNRFTSVEASYLAGVTSGIQSQIDSAFSAISSAPSATGRIARTGDTMSGLLGFTSAGVSPSRVAYIGANRELQTSTVVDNAELDFLDGVTSNLGAKVNLVTASEIGFLSGVTANIGSKENLFTTAQAGYLGGVTTSLIGWLGGVTSNIGSKVNLFTATEAGRLSGVTSGIQSQIDSAFSAISNLPLATGRIARTGDTMSGNLGLAGANTTPDRVAYLNANRELVTSNVVSSAELDFIDGVTSNVGSKVNLFTNTEAGYLSGVTTSIGSKLNLFTNTEAGYLSGVTTNIGSKLNRFSGVEGSYLAGVTSGIQSQIDSAFSTISNLPLATGRIARTGDTMSGLLGFTSAGVSPSRVAYIGANRELQTSTVVDNAELDFLDGVTSNLGAKVNLVTASEIGFLSGVTANIGSKENLFTTAQAGYLGGVTTSLIGWLGGVTSNIGSKINLFTATEAGRLSGVTSGIQSQIDSAFSAISNLPLATGRIARTGDTMSGNLGLAGANTTPDRVAYLNANRELVTSNVVSSAELDFIDGVTSNLGARINLFTNAEAGRLAGVTSGIQSQIDSAFSAISSIPSATNRVAKVGDTMTGGLGFQYAGVTPNRVAYIDANRQLMTSNTVTNTELDFLGGVTSNVGSKVNLFTALEAGRLAGVTSGIQSQIDSAFSAISSIPSAAARVAKTGDSMSGYLDVGGAIASSTAFNISALGGSYKIAGTPVLSVGTGAGAMNTFVGASAGASITTGIQNTFVGYQAGYSNTLGSFNHFTGTLAGYSNNSGNYNQFDGFMAGYSNTIGISNLASGYQSGYSNVDGTRNVFLGFYSGRGNTSGSYNTFLGKGAGLTVSTQSYNTFVGAQADDTSGAAKYSVTIGYNSVITGSSSVQLGSGTNATDNSLQFNSYNFLTSSGAATFASINGVTTISSAYLNGITANLQNQISSIPSATGRIARTGDTMTGLLGFQYAGVTPSRVAYIGANRELLTSNNVDNTELDLLDGVTSSLISQLGGVTSNIGAKLNLASAAELGYLAGVTSNIGAKLNLANATELGYLAGVTSNIGAKVNLFTAAEAGYLAGVTSGLQSQLSGKWTAIAGVSTQILTAGTGSGPTWSYGAITGNFSTAASNSGSNINSTLTCGSPSIVNVQNTQAGGSGNWNYTLPAAAACTGKTFIFQKRDAQASFIRILPAAGEFVEGATVKVIGTQNQSTLITAFDGPDADGWTAIDSNANTVSLSGSTMTGAIGLAYANATPDRVAYLDSSRQLRTSANVSSAELDFLDGVTANLIGWLGGMTTNIASKVNLVSATEMGYLAGVTNDVQTQLDALAMPTTIITGNTQAAVNNAYVTNSASLIGVTLPTSCALGSRIKVVGLGAGGWRIHANSGETIDYAASGDSGYSGSVTTSAGYLQSINAKAAVEVMCRVADTNWIVTASDGEYTGSYVSGVSTFTANGTLTIPANVRRVIIKAWGGGGGGGYSQTAGQTAGGGGGAAFTGATVNVKPGDVLAVNVGTGGAGGDAAGDGGGGGGFTLVRRNAEFLVLAAGGGGGGAARTSTGGVGGGGGYDTPAAGGAPGSGGSTQGLAPTAFVGGTAGTSDGVNNNTNLNGDYLKGGNAGGTSIGALGGVPGGGGGSNANGGGGGGGGGYMGGGGGGGDNNSGDPGSGGAGGIGMGQYGNNGSSGSGATGGNAGNNSDTHYAGNAGKGGTGGNNSAGTAGTDGRVVILW